MLGTPGEDRSLSESLVLRAKLRYENDVELHARARTVLNIMIMARAGLTPVADRVLHDLVLISSALTQLLAEGVDLTQESATMLADIDAADDDD